MSEVNDYNDLLNASWDEIPEQKLTPNGSWLLRGKNASFVAPKGDANGRVLFVYSPKDPIEVDSDAIAELEAEGYDVGDNQLFYTVWIERNSDWDKVRKHLAKHGIDDSSQTIAQSLKAFRNTQVVGHVGVRTFTRKGSTETTIENTVDNFAAVE